MASGIKLAQEGYKVVSIFNRRSRAEERAKLYRDQGHEARVVTGNYSGGTEFYAVYLKAKEE
jgi:shikimate 5-dehydrogenase